MTGHFDVPHGDLPGRDSGDEDTGRIGVIDVLDDPGDGLDDHGPDPGETSGHRHRPAPGRWIPAAHGGGTSHARTEPLPRVPTGHDGDGDEDDSDDYPEVRGVLALDDEVPRSRRTRRRRVLLTTASDAEGDEDVRVYSSGPRGLGTFDLGSVPASVTPPRTWRKAAWFASVASGAAVAAMLMAGSAFVSDSTDATRALDTWPGPNSPQPTLPGNDGNGTPRTGENTTEPAGPSATTSAQEGADGTRGALATHDTTSPTAAEAAEDVADGGEPAQDGTNDTDGVAVPPKPPVTPAPTERAPVVLWSKHDSDLLAQRSQQYFDTVTEDPHAAHALTTGELAAQGPEGLADRYADVAYFEVQEVFVDSREGYTLNTVKVTYTDGTTEIQTRKLVFSDDERIAADLA
ncbi:hypothetical protein [Saccharomonospora sp. NB11]|jgi:hypothetical protein|uniref:hypothetical protein n=1 Tax=Saccharomonospora sp. NB11 TaxID=1642298 RepID=UPI0018D05157|nr:hypothetical protein [Saccharomonospora sp. NB11]